FPALLHSAYAGNSYPHVENELSDALRIYEDEDTSDQAKSGCYDLCSDDMWSVTVYIIRTDL
ncbi:MAG: hypothetical protein Q4C16_10810, partial [Eubacteriales bacterium]|nr:hypothetical protein [Eubacteriales bacterium]